MSRAGLAAPELAICAPMYREEAIVSAFVARVRAAAEATDLPWALIIADDASPDETGAALRAAASELASHPSGRLLPLSLGTNRGQLGATFAALEAAVVLQPRWIVVLDGDLQDPPEQIPDLVAAARAAPEHELHFAVKQQRDDPAWMRAGAALYRTALGWLGSRPPPPGAGSYCVMDRALAERLIRLHPGQANIAPLCAALTNRWATVPYDKAARYDGASRVGALGLAREAWGSWVLAGAAERGAGLLGLLLTLLSMRWPACSLFGVAAFVVAGLAMRRRRAAGL
ncbi:MAG: glycosyltransferase [Deltaproteobacteria bacterium]|nr:glycosyltransferase [Deltaproteobacteria bacterium]